MIRYQPWAYRYDFESFFFRKAYPVYINETAHYPDKLLVKKDSSLNRWFSSFPHQTGFSNSAELAMFKLDLLIETEYKNSIQLDSLFIFPKYQGK